MTGRRDSPEQILERIYRESQRVTDTVISDRHIHERVRFVCYCMGNRAGARLLMSCMLANLHNPLNDPQKPYTEIGTSGSFSGRRYDEHFITGFVHRHRLPCNATTAFLTPTLRNRNEPLLPTEEYEGRPPELYKKAAKVLEDVSQGRIDAESVLIEIIRHLSKIRDERLGRMESLLSNIAPSEHSLPLSSEVIVTVLEQHVASRNASRLPVLMVAAMYQTIGDLFGECARPLLGHNAADLQTGSLGDVEVCLTGEDGVITAYEMKDRRVTIDDIDHACTKITGSETKIDNYIFITTDVIEPEVQEHARSLYDLTQGTEIVVLDCIGFVRYFLHLFHRTRVKFLDNYQKLVLDEPDSSVSQALKEVFLTLRLAAQSD